MTFTTGPGNQQPQTSVQICLSSQKELQKISAQQQWHLQQLQGINNHKQTFRFVLFFLFHMVQILFLKTFFWMIDESK